MGTTTATKEIEIIETLGRMAAECDLWAETPELSYRERTDAARKAAEYRARQVQLLEALQDPQPQKDATTQMWNGAVNALVGELLAAAVILIGLYLWLL